MSLSIAVISSMLAIILPRKAASSICSTRTRKLASGVRRSCPTAPSIRSLSDSIVAIRAR